MITVLGCRGSSRPETQPPGGQPVPDGKPDPATAIYVAPDGSVSNLGTIDRPTTLEKTDYYDPTRRGYLYAGR